LDKEEEVEEKYVEEEVVVVEEEKKGEDDNDNEKQRAPKTDYRIVRYTNCIGLNFFMRRRTTTMTSDHYPTKVVNKPPSGTPKHIYYHLFLVSPVFSVVWDGHQGERGEVLG
jgi:hypothetical protein